MPSPLKLRVAREEVPAGRGVAIHVARSELTFRLPWLALGFVYAGPVGVSYQTASGIHSRRVYDAALTAWAVALVLPALLVGARVLRRSGLSRHPRHRVQGAK